MWYLCGRGNLANAGGGGNAQESGGGGGGNGSAGGNGGNDALDTANGGIGGRALSYSNSVRRVFMGGSGGCPGPNDEDKFLAGSNGGGIILIRANQINGNGHSILANGVDEPIDSSASLFPGGGGGAGGVVLLDVGSYSSSVTVQANGGKGGDTRLSCTAGPGGGGGGGCIWFSGSSSTPTNVTRSVNGGASGVVVKFPGDSTPACLGSAHGATAGSNGVILTNYAIPEGTIPR